MLGQRLERRLESPMFRGALVEFVDPTREDEAKLSIGITRIDNARRRFGHGPPVRTVRTAAR